MLKIKYILKKYWSDFVGWGIVKSMNDLSLDILDFYAFVCCLGMKIDPISMWINLVCKGKLKIFFIGCSLP